MQVVLSGEKVKVKLNGNFSETDYYWNIKPLRDLLNNFSNEETYFEKLFALLYKVQKWAYKRKIEFSIQANKIIKLT